MKRWETRVSSRINITTWRVSANLERTLLEMQTLFDFFVGLFAHREIAVFLHACQSTMMFPDFFFIPPVFVHYAISAYSYVDRIPLMNLRYGGRQIAPPGSGRRENIISGA